MLSCFEFKEKLNNIPGSSEFSDSEIRQAFLNLRIFNKPSRQ